MNQVGQYVFSVSAAAIVIAVLRPFIDGKGATSAITKILCGIFLMLTILSPLTKISLSHWDDWTSDLETDASQVVASGQLAAKKELEAIITQQVQTYILDKGKDYNASLSATVILSDDAIPVPIGVTIQGSISPYGKRQMQNCIAKELGIAKEDQTWI